ncbi:MAG: ATP-binding protein [Rhodanobacteraceae bacterium]
MAPFGRDAQIASLILEQAGYSAFICRTVAQLAEEIARGAGFAIVTLESLDSSTLAPLADVVSAQEPWSDFPFLVLARQNQGVDRALIPGTVLKLLGNVTIVERPFHPSTLISVASTSVRSRRRQYQARSLLLELSANHERLEQTLHDLALERAALTDLTRELESRVEERTAALREEVTSRERAQSQLLHAQKMESLGQLTGGVAHDFNNLLMAIMANLEMLDRKLDTTSYESKLIHGAMQGAERGAALTQRMLAFARQQELVTCTANVRDLVTGARELIQRSIGPQIVLDDHGVPADLPSVRVDPVQFELALLNLAINARDAMPNGGRIEMRAGTTRLPVAATVKAGSYVWIDVTDRGTGMAGDTLSRATDPFFSTKPVGKGTGLGLSMVRGFLEQLGGTLTITSELGVGTTVRLLLPEVTGESADVSTSVPAAPTSSRRATILLVDDDALIAASTRMLLEDLGHTVLDAMSAESAIDIIERNASIDLVITDYAMPEMTGLELATYVRNFRPTLPVLLVTGFADLPSASLPDIARLSKPFKQAQLEEKLASLLGD